MPQTYGDYERCNEYHHGYNCSLHRNHSGQHEACIDHNLLNHRVHTWENTPSSVVGNHAPHTGVTYSHMCRAGCPAPGMYYHCSLEKDHSGPHRAHWGDNILNDLCIEPWDNSYTIYPKALGITSPPPPEPKIVKIKRHSTDERAEMGQRQIAELGGMDAIDPTQLGDDYLCTLSNHVYAMMACSEKGASALYDKLSAEKQRRNITTIWDDEE